MAERSKALVQDTNFFCDVGSNPTAANSFTFSFVEVNSVLQESLANANVKRATAVHV